MALQERGRPRVLTAAAGQAVYRVVEEGLTNAAKHAPGQPITVSLDWELDALLLTIVNPLPDDTADPSGATGGHGLAGLRERIDPLGGVLDHGRSGRTFRLFAMLPAMAEAPSQPSDSPPIGSVRTVALGFAIAALTFVILPLAMLVGVR